MKSILRDPTRQGKRALERIAMADGDYSEVERTCIAALAKRVKSARDQVLAERYSRAVRFES